MDKVCLAGEMRECDRLAAESFCIPSIILMENAAFAVTSVIEKKFNLQNIRAAVFCGKGNNGGDGLAIARQLSVKGADVCIYLTAGNSYSGDSLMNYKAAECMDIEMSDEISGCDISSYDVVIDAILGTGIKGTVYPEIADIINMINDEAAYVVSVDVPSGINSDTGEICGVCIKADETVTFAAYKRGLFLFPGCEFAGRITLSDISMPRELIKNTGAYLIDNEYVRGLIGKRKNNTHKGDYGKIFIIGGSRGLTGAAYLSSESALKCGGGLITLGICESLNNIMEEKLTEVMTLPLADSNGHLTKEAYPKIKRMADKCGCVLFGPGLGGGDDILYLLREILKNSRVPVIIDADGLNALSRDKSVLDECGCGVILTPHAGEMSRLCGKSIEYVEAHRYEVSSELAQELGAVIILKGHHTIVTGADGIQYINNTGNPGMASGGSGDVLAGMISAFAARGMSEADAAIAAVYLHGLAGDIAAEKYGENSLIPSDIIQNISVAFLSCMQQIPVDKQKKICYNKRDEFYFGI